VLIVAALQHLAVSRYDKLTVRYEECSAGYEKLLDRSVRFGELSVRYEECSAGNNKLLDRSVRYEEWLTRHEKLSNRPVHFEELSVSKFATRNFRRATRSCLSCLFV